MSARKLIPNSKNAVFGRLRDNYNNLVLTIADDIRIGKTLSQENYQSNIDMLINQSQLLIDDLEGVTFAMIDISIVEKILSGALDSHSLGVYAKQFEDNYLI